MPLYKVINNDSYVIGIWKLDEDENQLLSALSNKDVYKCNLENIKSINRRKEWLCTRVLLNLLCNSQEEINYLPSGSPFLKSRVYNISISHTKGFVTLIMSRKNKVAVDIEQYSDRVKKVVTRFIRQDEEIHEYNNDELWSMLLHWSAKETAFKLLDEDNVDFLEHLQIIPFNVNKNGEFLLKENKTDNHYNFKIHYLLEKEFVLTWSYK